MVHHRHQVGLQGAGEVRVHRLAGETAAPTDQLALAQFLSREIFGAIALNQQIASFDNRLDAEVQTRMRIEVRTLVERASRWLVNNRRLPLDSEEVIRDFEVTVEQVTTALPELMVGTELDAFTARCDALVAIGGSWGTLSEIALACRTGVPAWSIAGWDLPAEGGPVVTPDAEAAVAGVLAFLGGQ